MSYSEDDFIQLSALQHYVFCRRQCALIHIEQIWEENLFTAQGRLLHERADEQGSESRPGVRIERAMPLRSFSLGLSAKADVVEFYRKSDGIWQPFPVEYKRGKPKPDDCDTVQLCAQALCLEEMLKVSIPFGAVFYGKTRRRLDVVFDEALRQRTGAVAHEVHRFIEAGITPAAEYMNKCDSCSLYNVCLPKTMGTHRSVKEYVREMLAEEGPDGIL